MQFIENGPDIPNALLQAHEEGRVIFFCGAGISYPAKLPGFQGLVDDIYDRLGTTCTDIEHEAYKQKQFDTVLDLLERRIPGQRIAVWKQLQEALKPKLRCRGAMDTHVALLHLSRSRKGTLRLVTTNFDRIFEHAAKKSKQKHRLYAAPTLPIPKPSRWDGLVYLHGILPSEPDDNALNRLVVTSGDFGLAYLTEGWAARFVSELLRNFIVCFVGYSINDPILRYMMDALAADRMLGESTPQAYALGACEPGQEKTESVEWKSKGVVPILYQLRPRKNHHMALHQTLTAWSKIYRDGLSGKESIVVKHASIHPSESTQQDDFVGRMLWALSDKLGLPAKRFAAFDPVPPLEWLMALSENCFQHNDLDRFDISLRQTVDADLRFSLINRPTSCKHTPWMNLGGSAYEVDWDKRMSYVAQWLIRHLNDRELLYWLLENGNPLHSRLSGLIEDKLDELESLRREDNSEQLDRIRRNSPNAIPSQTMRLLWHLFLRGRVKSSGSDLDLHRWIDCLYRDGLSASLRMKLRQLLAPMLVLRRPSHFPDERIVPDESTENLGQIVDWELELAADHADSAIPESNNEIWQAALPALLDDFQQLLRDAMDLLHEMGEADDRHDGSFMKLSSLHPHWQNRKISYKWTTVIKLLRDAWLAVRSNDPARASRVAEHWFERPYPVFKRLAFFAASHDGCIDSSRWCAWLLSDERWWLWSEETRREVMRLLVLQGHCLASSQGQLETAILDGPPRYMYRKDLEPERWKKRVNYSVWLRLAKLNASGLKLGHAAQSRFDTLSSDNPQWNLCRHESDEFAVWMSGTGDPDYEEKRRIDIAPRKRRDLVQWLKSSLDQQRLYDEDTWRETCRTRFFDCLSALRDLSQAKIWPETRWREALQVWSEEDQIRRSWQYAAPLIQTMPDDILQQIVYNVAWWLKSTSKATEGHEQVLLDLCQRILNFPLESHSGITLNNEPLQDPVTEAINHPVGCVTQALLSFWFKCEPSDNDGLPDHLEPLFTKMCDIRMERFRHGRVLLASGLIALFRIDRAWTEKNLLPLFQWANDPEEAQAVWKGFLRSPRLYPPLLTAFKPAFLETANHYNELTGNALNDYGRQYAAFLTHAALERIDGYRSTEFQSAFMSLPQAGLEEAARTLSRAFNSVSEAQGNYWTHRVKPFWQDIWPKSRDLISRDIAESLASVCIDADNLFPEALALFKDWLRLIQHPHHIILELQQNNLCEESPAETLDLLDRIIGESSWPSPKLGACLNAILKAVPNIQHDHRYQRLSALC